MKNKRFHPTRNPVTDSSIQLMDYHHGHHYLLKVQAQQCLSTELQPCWHNTGNRSWKFDPNVNIKKLMKLETSKLSSV